MVALTTVMASEGGGDWVDGPESQLGGRNNRQVINWMFEERESKLMPSWELDRIHPPLQSVCFCGDKITRSDMCARGVGVPVGFCSGGKQWRF